LFLLIVIVHMEWPPRRIMKSLKVIETQRNPKTYISVKEFFLKICVALEDCLLKVIVHMEWPLRRIAKSLKVFKTQRYSNILG
jgi:hypothetical protein